MRTKELRLRTDWIRTGSLDIRWYRNGQMRRRYERKNGKWHGDCKTWRRDGSIWSHRVWKNGRVVKRLV